MRKKIAVGVGLIGLVIVGMVLADWWTTPAEPPLRVGMTIAEVQAAMGKQDTWLKSMDSSLADDPEAEWKVSGMHYGNGTDWLGNYSFTNVYLDNDGRVTNW